MYLVKAKDSKGTAYVGTFDAAGIRWIDSPITVAVFEKAGVPVIPVTAKFWNNNRASKTGGLK